MNSNINVLHLDRTITRLGLPLGYDGGPLAERFPDGRTLGDFYAAYELLSLLPVGLRKWDRSVALKMCQAAVFGRTHFDDRRLPSQASSNPTADAKLARERNRKRTKGAA